MFALSDEEYAMILNRMEQCGVTNMSAYLRKMAIDGYCLKLDISEIKELISLFRRIGNNINQIAKAANAGGYICDEDIRYVKDCIAKSWNGINLIAGKLSTV